MQNQLKNLLIHQAIIRLGDESIPRIIKCLQMLDDQMIWHQFNENTNSIGNLVLHLEGNATQWILSTFGDVPDLRVRDSEFEPSQFIPGAQLVERLNTLKTQLINTLNHLEEDSLAKTYKVQCFEENGLGIIVHVIEHFSYHTGQIAFITKLLLNKQTYFYEDLDLNIVKD